MQLFAYRNTMARARPAPNSELGEVWRSIEQIRAEKREQAEAEAQKAEVRRQRAIAVTQAMAEKSRLERELASLRRKVSDETDALTALREAVEAATEEARKLMEGPTLTIGAIAGHISAVSGVSLDSMRSDRRDKHLTLARHAVCYWAHRLTGKSLPQIGRFLGKDHTTVLHAVRRYPEKKFAAGRKSLEEMRAKIDAAMSAQSGDVSAAPLPVSSR